MNLRRWSCRPVLQPSFLCSLGLQTAKLGVITERSVHSLRKLDGVSEGYICSQNAVPAWRRTSRPHPQSSQRTPEPPLSSRLGVDEPTWANVGLRQRDRERTEGVSKVHLVAPTTVAARHDLAATAAERRQIGRQARVLAPRARHRGVGRAGPRTRPHRHADRPERHPPQRGRALAPSAHGRLAVELLPGRCRRHGRRLGVTTAQPHSSPTLR